MSENASPNKDEIFSKVLRAGRRTYFFDVRATQANDFYLTITESKKHENNNGDSYYKKHKIYLYKEDFERFKGIMDDVMDYIIKEKGEEVISDRHNPDFKKEEYKSAEIELEEKENNHNAFIDVNFDEI